MELKQLKGDERICRDSGSVQQGHSVEHFARYARKMPLMRSVNCLKNSAS